MHGAPKSPAEVNHRDLIHATARQMQENPDRRLARTRIADRTN